MLESIRFEENSQLERIEGWVLCESLKKLEIPKNLKDIVNDGFQYAYVLEDIGVSCENEMFSWINNTFLNRKEDGNNSIIFCKQNAIEIEIPKYTKGIDTYAFNKCKNLISI